MEQQTSTNKNVIFIIIALIGIGAIALMFTASGPAEAPVDGDDENGIEAPANGEENGEETDPASEATETISVYLVQVTDGQEQLVAATRRIERTPGVARASLEQLLSGPTAAEIEQGLSTAIPEGTTLQDIRIENGTAYVDFSSELSDGVAGSALVMAIRGQIEQTLLQFPTVSSVVISVDGESEEILQP